MTIPATTAALELAIADLVSADSGTGSVADCSSEEVNVWLGLGSNLADPPAQLDRAIAAIAELPETKLLASSSYYRSLPLVLEGQSSAGQADYCNAVVKISSRLVPLILLDFTQAIEAAQGRIRDAERWGPRTLDIDILLYAESCLQNERLTIPHPGLLQRAFVIEPLLELDETMCIPQPGGAAIKLSELSLSVADGNCSHWYE